MKKILLAIAILFGALTASAQTDITATLKKANAPLPTVVTDGMTLNSITLADDCVVFDYTLTDDVFTSLQSMRDILRDAMVAEVISSPDALYKELMAYCRANKINIVQMFSNSAGEKIDIVITPKDME